jgi:diguanylate cyclase (GGDEF)-like protein/PAS domain S-box-containing protein
VKLVRRAVDNPGVEAPSLRSERRARVMLAATLLFAGIFAARVLDRSASSGTTILYVLPIVLVGVELGYRAGLAAGLVALGLFAVWAPFAPIHVAWSAYVTRGVVFVLVGAVAGRLADRLDRALRSADAGARHFELARDLLCTATLDGHLTHLNGSWEECLGWTREELMAKPFVAFVHPGDRDRTAARLAAGELTVNFRNRFQHKDGSWRWIEWSSRADPERGLLHAAARDVTAARQLEQARDDALEQLRFLADHDPLSGVYNRRRFAQELRRELAAAGHATRCSVVLLIDVDEFKAINDALGHAMGDAVIGCLGAALSRRLRTGDVVARLGGDEFAVLLRRINVETAMRMAHDLQALVSARIAELLGDAHPPVTLSLGLAAVGGPDAARTVDDLLGRADRALYAAKRAGKNRVIATPVAAAGVAGPDAAVG